MAKRIETFCCGKPMTGIQYRGTTEDWDGISEWRCEKCGHRVGRWSGRILQDNEIERRYGGDPVWGRA